MSIMTILFVEVFCRSPYNFSEKKTQLLFNRF